MARYKQRPEVVDAEQFEGGAESANHIARWLEGKGCEATWIDNQTVKDIHLQERLTFTIDIVEPKHKLMFSAYKNDYIVEKNGRFRIFSAKEFSERFEKI